MHVQWTFPRRGGANVFPGTSLFLFQLGDLILQAAQEPTDACRRLLAALPNDVVHTVGRSCKVHTHDRVAGDDLGLPPRIVKQYHLKKVFSAPWRFALVATCFPDTIWQI